MKNLTALPDLFSALTNLQRLVLRWNEISTFPTILLSLSRLTFLDVSGNGLTEVPPEISQLSELQHLNLTYNKLQVPPLFFTLSHPYLCPFFSSFRSSSLLPLYPPLSFSFEFIPIYSIFLASLAKLQHCKAYTWTKIQLRILSCSHWPK